MPARRTERRPGAGLWRVRRPAYVRRMFSILPQALWLRRPCSPSRSGRVRFRLLARPSRRSALRGRAFLVSRRALPLCAALFGIDLWGQEVLNTFPAVETPGARPYEMVWADRREAAPPTLRFDDLEGWRLEVAGGGQAMLQRSHAQNLWDRPVARLRYRGDGNSASQPRLVLVPPRPIAVPAGADAVECWLFGNRWEWENPPDTPPVRWAIEMREATGQTRKLELGPVRWKEWWLMHRRLPAGLAAPVECIRIEITGGWQAEWRELFLDSIRFYAETREPLKFAARRRRNLEPFPGQATGVNTGRGRLEFPTREQTILPRYSIGGFTNRVSAAADGQFVFAHHDSGGPLVYRFDAARGLSGLRAEYRGAPVGALMDGGGVRRPGDVGSPALKSASLTNDVVSAEYADGTTLRFRLWQRTLVLDAINGTAQATELDFGQLTGVNEPRTVFVPYLNYGGGPHPCVLLSRAGGAPLFTSIWLDWYRSNGSEPFAAESADAATARINGGVRYQPLTDGRRNPLFERVFITVSPTFEEVLPTIPNPVGRHAAEAVDRLWQESWGPDDYEKQMARSRMLRAHGIERLIQCNHEIAWRDGGESFTLRLRAAPGKGGDEALKRYVAHQRSLDWLSGLYSNYTDYAPVNRFWTPDGVQRLPDGNWRTAWPRCYALKPLAAVELDAQLAPRIKDYYRPTSAYTDVHTAVAPWGYCDYDARVPGAGTFAQTFYAYGELLRNDSRVYDGPIFSEGTYQWLYAGLADGNYALAYDGRPLAKEPLLPVFDLLEIHPKECDIGMGWTAHFCDAIPDWRKPENLDRAIDRFLLHTLAYGHIGWLVEEEHGMARTCRSYYMLQPVQARYGLKEPERIAYWDGTRLRSVSEAIVADLPRTRRQLYVAYPGGLELWLNDHPTEDWVVTVGDRRLVLPPAGWAAHQPREELLTYSALVQDRKVDYLRSEGHVYLDGRGQRFAAPEAASNGALAIRRLRKHQLEVLRFSGDGAFTIARPYGMAGRLVSCEAFDAQGERLAAPRTSGDRFETAIEPVPQGLRYVLRFDGQR